MAIIRHMRRSAISAGRPGGLITEITWKGIEMRKISADINLERKLSTVKRTARGEADPHGKRIAGDED